MDGIETIEQQKDFMRGLREAGLKDAELARRTGCTAAFVSQVRHGSKAITRRLFGAAREISMEIAAEVRKAERRARRRPSGRSKRVMSRRQRKDRGM